MKIVLTKDEMAEATNTPHLPVDAALLFYLKDKGVLLKRGFTGRWSKDGRKFIIKMNEGVGEWKIERQY